MENEGGFNPKKMQVSGGMMRTPVWRHGCERGHKLCHFCHRLKLSDEKSARETLNDFPYKQAGQEFH